MNLLGTILPTLLLATAAFAAPATTPMVRVRIVERAPIVALRGYDLKLGRTPMDRLSQWVLECRNGKVFARGKDSHQKSSLLELASPAQIETPAGFLNVADRPYRGKLQVYSKNNQCDVIDEVDLEKYLDGLVNSEFSAKWSEESIAAQVVAARTYALYQIREGRRLHARFDVDPTTKDQVYDGSMKEDFRSSRSVEKTRGMVLTVGPESHPIPIKAFYHSTCGGATELPQNVWGRSYSGFKKRVSCPYCVTSPRYHWDLDLSSAEISRLVETGAEQEDGAHGWPADWNDFLHQGTLQTIDTQRKNSERVETVTLKYQWGPRSVSLPIRAPDFRNWMGAARLRSTLFAVRAEKNSWHFEGRGNGHGVGMCQWGAKVMGEKGFGYSQILKMYYPDAILRKLW